MTAGANEALVELPDEGTLTIPEGWHRSLHPRRGGLAVAPVKVAKGAVAKARGYLGERKAEIESLTGDLGDAWLVERTLRHLAGEADPVGAAIVALVTQQGRAQRDATAVLKTFTDSWVIEHGLAFAACAVVELGSIRIIRTGTHADEVERGAVHGGYLAFGLSEIRACLRRVRALLATAGKDEYERAVEALEGMRGEQSRRAVVSYLVPTRDDWVAECCAEMRPYSGYSQNDPRATVFMALGSADHVVALGNPGLSWSDAAFDVVATLVDGLGVDVLPIFTESLATSYLNSDNRRRLLEAMSVLPSDEAFQALLDRLNEKHVQSALPAMMNRFPARAVRMLADAVVTLRARGETKAAGAVEGLLEGHLLTHPDVVAAVRPGLPEESRAVLAAVAGASERIPEAPAEALPSLLVAPPWTRPREAPKPAVIQGLRVPEEGSMEWAEGEYDAWAAGARPPWGLDYPAETDWKAVAEQYRAGRLPVRAVAGLIRQGPEELVRAILPEWEGYTYWDAGDLPWMRSIVARYGLDALPLMLRAAKANPGTCSKMLIPYLDARVAAQMAIWLERGKTARSTAMSWCERHGMRAARLLIPAALGRAGQARRAAEGALVLIASRNGDEAIVEAAREYGDKAAEVIAAMLAADPLDRLPAKMPRGTDWADPVRLPQVLLRAGKGALPGTAVRHLVTMLAMSKPGEVYAGLDVVKEACDLQSLAAFSWGLFQEWQRYGAPSKDGWALHQLGWLGDDDTVRRLTPVIRAWPGEGGHQKAVTGLDVLAGIGSDVALLHLHGISQKVKFKGLKTRAQEKIAEVAAGLGLGAEQLADRLVPDFGLDGEGGMALDYGPRRFTVGFDEQLKPYVMDEDGKRRRALPKPGAKDDQELAPAAYKRFADLKKDVRTVASDQVTRLEKAMVTGRHWTPEEFQSLFVEHPLIWHIARRVVWLAKTDDGNAPFRLAEDRTLADADEDAFTVPGHASITIAHPLDLGDDLKSWSEVFADYEIMQPFPQLGREVHVLTEEERASGRLARFEGITVPVHSVLGLVRRGWERGEALDNGVERFISKPVPGGLHVVIDLDGGIYTGYVQESENQGLNAVWIDDRPDDFRPGREPKHTFGELSPVAASEVLADLTWLAASAL